MDYIASVIIANISSKIAQAECQCGSVSLIQHAVTQVSLQEEVMCASVVSLIYL